MAFISDLYVNDNVVERVHVFKLLGVLLDDNLKWDSHVDAIMQFARKLLFVYTF